MRISVTLTPAVEEAVRRLVDEGSYSSAEDAVSAALELITLSDKSAAEDADWLREAYMEGLASGDAGEVDFAEIRREGHAWLAAERR